MKQLTALVLVLASTTLAAADTKATKPAAKPAKLEQAPTDAKLAQLVGRWEGTSDFTIDGKTTTWKVSTSCERVAVGPAILCSTIGVAGDQQLDEDWMFGFDQHSATYHLFMTNDWGEAYDHAATWTDAATVAFIHNGTRDNKKLVENYTLSFKPDQMIWKGGFTIGDKTIATGSTTLKRVK